MSPDECEVCLRIITNLDKFRSVVDFVEEHSETTDGTPFEEIRSYLRYVEWEQCGNDIRQHPHAEEPGWVTYASRPMLRIFDPSGVRGYLIYRRRLRWRIAKEQELGGVEEIYSFWRFSRICRKMAFMFVDND